MNHISKRQILRSRKAEEHTNFLYEHLSEFTPGEQQFVLLYWEKFRRFGDKVYITQVDFNYLVELRHRIDEQDDLPIYNTFVN